MQRIIITGYLSKNAETRQVGDGMVATLNIPVKQGWGEREQTNWFRVSVWGKRAEHAGKLVKGDFITATGDLTIGEYNNKPQYEIRADDYHPISKSGGERPARQERKQADTSGDGWGGDGDGWDAPF